MNDTATESNAERHWLLDTLCDLLAYRGKALELTPAQAMLWTERLNLLERRHGEDKLTTLLGDCYNAGQLKPSTTPDQFAAFCARMTTTLTGEQPRVTDEWTRAMNCARAEEAGSRPLRKTVVRFHAMDRAFSGLMASTRANCSTWNTRDDEPDDSERRARCTAAMDNLFGSDDVDRWLDWRKSNLIGSDVADRIERDRIERRACQSDPQT